MRNKLIAYFGGLYSGNFWEWNFALWDHDGKFHDVFSSGRNGLFQYVNDCPTRATETAEQMAKDMLKNHEDRAELIDLKSKNDLKHFADTWPVQMVVGVVRTVDKIIPDSQMYWVCTDCGKHFGADDTAQFENYHGLGGLASEARDALCVDCHSMGSCNRCGEYWGAAELDSSGCCKCCIDKNMAAAPAIKEEYDALTSDISRVSGLVAGYKQLCPKYAKKVMAWFSNWKFDTESKQRQLLEGL